MSNSTAKDENIYWASVPPKEISREILDKRDKYYDFLGMNGRMDLYRRSWAYYFRPRISGAMINPTGEQGELTAMNVNHYKNLLAHLETLTTQQRAQFEPVATNSDVKSQSQVILAAGLLDYYMREKKLDRFIKQGVKDALMYGEGFIRAEWSPTSGNTYGKTDTGATIYEGDMKYHNYMPLDVIRDFTKLSPEQDWYIVRDFQNKFDLAAKYPHLQEEILNDSADMLEMARTTTINALVLENSDNIPVYTLIHQPTPALPQGRFTAVLDNDTVLHDGPLPYSETHVYRIAPDEESGTCFGFTVGFDLLNMQEAVDVLYSTILTNQSTFGVQNILVPKGHDLSTSQISGGLNLMEYDPAIGEPKALNLTQTPAEIFNFISMLVKDMETISGVNSVARGNPEASLKSGAALALVQSMTIQFSAGLQQSYANLVEDLGTGTIKILQQYASTPRIARIVGKSKRPLMREFKGEDLNLIQRVIVDMGNPLTRTTAGKVNLAENLMQNNMIENTDQYIQVVTTGRLEPVVEGKQASLLLIKGENEGLADGMPQRALITDDHQKHILEHTTVLANPDIRQDPNNPIVVATLAHIQEHMAMMNDPNVQRLAAILHKENVPALAPAMPGAPAPGQMDGGTADMLNPQAPIIQAAGEVQPASLPNPPAGTDPNSAAIINAQKGQ